MATTSTEFSSQQLQTIDRQARQIGQKIFSALHTGRTMPWQRKWWGERMMEWAMRDEDVKVQMFRFVDVLPTLRTSSAIVEHLHEYLGGVSDRLPGPMRWALPLAKPRGLAGRALASASRIGAENQARQFIAGSNVAQVLAAARQHRAQRRAFTLDILGEAVASEAEAERYYQAYLDLIRGVAPTVNSWPEVPQIDRDPRGPLPRTNISIKLSALDSQADEIDPEGTFERVGTRLRTILRAAREHQVFINVDMESYHIKDLTLDIFKRILMEDEFRATRDVGIVIQCYLRDSGRDLVELRDWAVQRGTPVWVRIVKGAYWDYETIHAKATGWPVPVYEQKWETDANYERQIGFMLQNRDYLRPAIASHNVRSLAYALAVAESLNVPQNDFELQMLYGMADAEKQVIVDLGYRMRVYMPYGELIPGMAYLVRRLLENTSNDSFLRASNSQNVALESLLMNPNEHQRASDGNSKAPARKSSDASSVNPANWWKHFDNEPPADFAKAENRQKMQMALEEVKNKLGRHWPLVIGGQKVDTPERIESRDPGQRSRVVGTTASATAAHVQQAVEAAKRAQAAWVALGAQARAQYLRQAAEVMRRRKFELAAWETYECAKGWREADADICEAIDFCEFYASGAIALEQEGAADVPGEENRFVYAPRGVAAVISPWNFPLAIVTGMTVAALATGNTVVVKPAEQAGIVGAWLMEIFDEVGLPPGVLNFLPGDGEVAGAALVDHPDVSLIAFTGSRPVGLYINARAAEVSRGKGVAMVKHVIAEMGGKNAIIVDDDADLDEAVLGVLKSAFGYQGQKCSACSRAIVLESAYETFLHRLVEATRSLKVGPASDPSSSVGPVIDDQSLQKVRSYVEIGRQEAREVLAVDTGELAAQGNFVGPHIFADVAPTARIAQEEIFGPVLAVIKAKDLDEALQIANGTEYALTGGMYSRSPANLERATREFMVGNLYLNRTCTGAMVGRQPFGGFKMSGIGTKAGGPDYLLQFVIPRTVTENTLRRGFAPQSEQVGS